jgi:hypothetical protein
MKGNGMKLAQVVKTPDGKESYLTLCGEFESMDALRSAMRNTPGNFIEGKEYTLVEKKPYLKVKKTETFTVEES